MRVIIELDGVLVRGIRGYSYEIRSSEKRNVGSGFRTDARVGHRVRNYNNGSGSGSIPL